MLLTFMHGLSSCAPHPVGETHSAPAKKYTVESQGHHVQCQNNITKYKVDKFAKKQPSNDCENIHMFYDTNYIAEIYTRITLQ